MTCVTKAWCMYDMYIIISMYSHVIHYDPYSTFDLWFNMEPWIFMQGGHFDEEFKIQEVCDPFHTIPYLFSSNSHLS